MTEITWTLHRQQQQCGVQLPNKARQPGEVPKEAAEDRAAQDHEQAGEVLQPGDYPASPLEDKDQDNTPDAAYPDEDWDRVVQPQRQVGEASHDSNDLPEGK